MSSEKRSGISRRDFIAGLVAFGASLTGIFAWYDLWSKSFLKDHVPWASLQNRDRLNIDEFMRLSSLLTGHSELDRDTALSIQSALEAQPKMVSRLVRMYEGVRKHPSNRTAETLRQGGFFKNSEYHALSTQLISVWYTGVLYLPGQAPSVVTYFGALMHRCANSTPLLCNGEFGYWAKKKEG